MYSKQSIVLGCLLNPYPAVPSEKIQKHKSFNYILRLRGFGWQAFNCPLTDTHSHFLEVVCAIEVRDCRVFALDFSLQPAIKAWSISVE